MGGKLLGGGMRGDDVGDILGRRIMERWDGVKDLVIRYKVVYYKRRCERWN